MAAAASSSSALTEIEIVSPVSEIGCSPPTTSVLPIHYQVFINHRGQDVKKTFASHIYHTLHGRGIRVFLDRNEMERGESITHQIEAAIRSSSVHIAIFSQNYASSRWCLDELCMMMEHPQKILPVFYNVKPSDLRYLDKDGPYATAMRVHEKNGRYDSQTVEKWKKTLISVAEISGYELRQFNGDEGELLKNIVDNVCTRVKREPWDVAKYPVGLNELAEDFEQKMLQANRDYEENVTVVGIVGMGGLGKTTLATHIFNIKQSIYDRSCFLSDVRSHNSLPDLQSILLKDLTGVDEKIRSVNQGIGILKNRLSSCHALVILDDIDDLKQLEALLVVRDVLRAGSMIVVTSRVKGLLGASGISRLYSIGKLGKQHARELFCWHAFGQPFPKEGSEDFVERFLKVCDGLPLSLKVFGALLCGNDDRVYWRCQLEKVSQRLEADIKERLKVSFDALEENNQEMFLDVASFFIGEDKAMAIRIWDGCGWHGLIGFQTLEQRCLVEPDEEGRIRMHDHLRDLGRDIIDDEASKNSQKPRRFWRPKDIDDLLKQRYGTAVVIRGIKMLSLNDDRRGLPWMQPLRRLLRCFDFEQPHSSSIRVTGLKLLDIEGHPLRGLLESASRDIRWLRWRRCPYKRLPSWLPMENFTVLDVDGWNRLETLWDGFKQFPAQLRELSVRSGGLPRFPKSIGDLKHLEKIVLKGARMKSLPEEFCLLQSLKHLHLADFYSLEVLPENLGTLTNLQHLALEDCPRLRTLPESFGTLIHLRYLSLSDGRPLIIPRDILGNIKTLEFLEFSKCYCLEVLPGQITHQTSLQRMMLFDTALKELPENIGNLCALKDLWLGRSPLPQLPPSIWTLTNLTALHLQACLELKSLAHSECSPNSGMKHSRGVQQLKNLEYLEISNCPLGEVVPFTSIKSVDEEESVVGSTDSAGQLPKLRTLIIRDTNICKISISEDVCPHLKRLDLSGNSNLVEIVALPHTLEVLDIRHCEELEEVPNVGGLSALERIDAEWCWKLKPLEGLEQLKRCRIIISDMRKSTNSDSATTDSDSETPLLDDALVEDSATPLLDDAHVEELTGKKA